MSRWIAVLALAAGLLLMQGGLAFVEHLAGQGAFYPEHPATAASGRNVEAANISLARGAVAAVLGGGAFLAAGWLWRRRNARTTDPASQL